jgi:hypothetical protein
MFQLEWFREKRVGKQIDLPDGKIVGGAPVGVNPLKLLLG